jgi:hypothetical protein
VILYNKGDVMRTLTINEQSSISAGNIIKDLRQAANGELSDAGKTVAVAALGTGLVVGSLFNLFSASVVATGIVGTYVVLDWANS